ncbi:hypothetical protein ACIRRA_34005 [Nocardia sp. NPDC101769]|uniref:hypothetical protein n=1 Tax=Nocardia sp. NPDC101769 TaxID=3364333 RepID=UPI003808CCD8
MNDQGHVTVRDADTLLDEPDVPFTVTLAHQDQPTELTFEAGTFRLLDSGVLQILPTDEDIRYFAPGHWLEIRETRD